jgi:predicted DNA-binding protein with PD1-like motif
LGGSIAKVNDKIMFHIHCAVADSEHVLKGGHVTRGKVAVLNEISILKLEEITLTRELNPDTGLMEMIIPEDME